MRSAIPLLLALATPLMAAAAAPAPAPPAKSLWVDWSTLARRAAEAQPAPRGTVEEAQALGDRIGRMVAAGDCRGGEKMALAAGDAKLALAVRNYCLR
jgi:hypothetical protein